MKINEQLLIVIVLTALLIGSFFIYSFFGNNKSSILNSESIKTSSTIQTLVPIRDYENYRVFSFNPGINHLDLNFDGIEDNIFVSHINGADYFDYHIDANRDIYNFFINNQSYWNIVTKEALNKKIDVFERDFVVKDLLACNGGNILRIVQTKNNETLLVFIEENTDEKDGANTRVKFSIYKLKMSGEIAGSDYIFSLIKRVIGTSVGCHIDKLGDADLIDAIKEAGF